METLHCSKSHTVSKRGHEIQSGMAFAGYLPHWEAGEVPQAICFRLADSLPRAVVDRYLADLASWPESKAKIEERRRIEAVLDQGHGEAFLARSDIGAIVEDAMLFFDGIRYHLHAWCVMPNHVHALVTPLAEHSLSSLAHAWKSFSAHRINQALNRDGQVWFKEYFDRRIRDERHF
ncbi:transposase [Labrys monachus]|uniref:Transposase IS200-like domain-containing protein n=1 Tax=Labrys monachus TaxID=217067 RepID=A0ABU0FCY1_9HYPH|nr:transposase [Labrys monachus]MDQ0392472.1 hypothetical protein [Labrys monachus]